MFTGFDYTVLLQQLPNGDIDWDKKTNYIANTDNCPRTPEAFAKSAASSRYYGNNL